MSRTGALGAPPSAPARLASARPASAPPASSAPPAAPGPAPDTYQRTPAAPPTPTPDPPAIRAAVAHSALLVLPIEPRGLTRAQDQAAAEAHRLGKPILPVLLAGTERSALPLELRALVALEADGADASAVRRALDGARDRLPAGATYVARFPGDALAEPRAPRRADVFLSYAPADAAPAAALEARLRAAGKTVTSARTDDPALPTATNAALHVEGARQVWVLVGAGGATPRQRADAELALTHAVETQRWNVVPVLLDGAQAADLPLSLRQLTEVELDDRWAWGRLLGSLSR